MTSHRISTDLMLPLATNFDAKKRDVVFANQIALNGTAGMNRHLAVASNDGGLSKKVLVHRTNAKSIWLLKHGWNKKARVEMRSETNGKPPTSSDLIEAIRARTLERANRMSDIIKPEDVPDEMVKHYLSTKLGVSWKHLIASDMNAAIKAGLVSPPCHVKRHLGELECQGGTLNPQVFIGKPKEEGDEHWKGQTK